MKKLLCWKQRWKCWEEFHIDVLEMQVRAFLEKKLQKIICMFEKGSLGFVEQHACCSNVQKLKSLLRRNS